MYGQQKQQLEAAQMEIQQLRAAAESQDPALAGNPAEYNEAVKRLKKRELECQALWDTLKDILDNFDATLMLQIFKKRHLDTKAARKLNLKV